MADLEYRSSGRPPSRQDHRNTKQKCLEEVSVHVLPNRGRKTSPRATGTEVADVNKKRDLSRFVYVNDGFAGSATSLSVAGPSSQQAVATGVVREQYWACTKWPRAQKLLAVTVGVLVGTVVGLSMVLIIRAAANETDIMGPIFRSSVLH